jgi:hypothetical protein
MQKISLGYAHHEFGEEEASMQLAPWRRSEAQSGNTIFLCRFLLTISFYRHPWLIPARPDLWHFFMT